MGWLDIVQSQKVQVSEYFIYPFPKEARTNFYRAEGDGADATGIVLRFLTSTT